MPSSFARSSLFAAVAPLILAVTALLVLAPALQAAPQVSVQIAPARAGPEPYPVLPAYPFDLTAQGRCVLDEKTAAALSAGEASLSETYAWEYEPAEAVLPPQSISAPEGSCGRFLYREKFAGTRQQIAVTYTVAITWLKEDRPPQEHAATDTLDVLVMYSGGGQILEGGAAELYLYPPDQNGQTCDMITVYAKVYLPYVFGDLQMRGAGGQWYSMNPMLVESTPQYTLWCCGWSTADVPDLKNTRVDWRVVYWDYYQWPPVQHSEEESWYRYNTVVHCPAEKVLAWDPYDEGNCDTNAEFTLDHLNYGNPDWTVTLKIYNAAGGLIRTLVQEGGFQVGENAVEWDGSLEPPPYGPGGTALKGIYVYAVEAVHTEGSPYWPNEMCKDKDKASSPELRITAVHKISFDVPDLVLVLDVDYEALQAAATEGRIAIYDPAFNQIAVHYVGPNGDGQVPQGYSGAERFNLQLAADQMGVFTAVFIGEQTATAGLENRDGQPKAARQGLGSITVFLVDLDAWGVSEAEEDDNPGAFVRLNDDDDDENSRVDMNEVGPEGGIPDEDDLLPITLVYQPSDSPEGELKLEALSGGSKIKVWKTAGKGTVNQVSQEVTLPATWDLTEETPPETLYVEGVQTSEDLRDVALKLSWSIGGNEVGSDIVRFTVWGFHLSKCHAAWLPVKDLPNDNADTTQITASITPVALVATIKFTLYEVSSELGYCVNAGDQTDNDLKFVQDEQNGFTVGGAQDSEATSDEWVNSGTVVVHSYDYGAYGKIKAEAILIGEVRLARVADSGEEFATIPRDDEDREHNPKWHYRNGIADAWERTDDGAYAGAAEDDAEVSLDNNHHGDGLTRYEEYRGVDIDHDGLVSDQERLNPTRKDLFVQGVGFGGDFPDFAYGSAFAEAEIVVHDFVGQVGTDDRGIDVLVVTAVDEGEHTSHEGIRYWPWDHHGQSGVGTGDRYGSPCVVRKRAVNYTFSDRPYADGATWSGPGQWEFPPNGTLDWVTWVEDTNDNGTLDGGEDQDGDALLDGDYAAIVDEVPDYDRELSVWDIDNDELITCPQATSIPVPPEDEANKALVVRHTVTHEMGHAVGIFYLSNEGHCEEQTCLMFKDTNNFRRDGHLCQSCRGMILIHND